MAWIFIWILCIPVLYTLYYSDFRNRFPTNNSRADVQRFRIRAFILAVTGFVGLGAYIMTCFILMIITILRESNVVNPFKIFPLCFPGKE